MEIKEHSIIFDLRNLRSGIGSKKLLQKIYVVHEGFAYECIVVPMSMNMEQNSDSYMCGVLSPERGITDITCTFAVDHYTMININEVPFDGVIVNDQKIVEKIIEKEKIIKEYYNIYSFIS